MPKGVRYVYHLIQRDLYPMEKLSPQEGYPYSLQAPLRGAWLDHLSSFSQHPEGLSGDSTSSFLLSPSRHPSPPAYPHPAPSPREQELLRFRG